MYAYVADTNLLWTANMLKGLKIQNSLPKWGACPENQEGQFQERKVQGRTLG